MQEVRGLEFNDVALRESDQVEGGKMSPRDQITYVELLMDGGIDRIEIGYPGSSAQQKENCRKIVQFVKNWSGKKKPLLSGLATADKKMIKAVKDVGCDICHIYVPSSKEFISAMFNAKKYGRTLAGKQRWVIEQSVAMIKYAKSLGFDQIEYSPEDAARSSREFIAQLVEIVITAGATIINIPDTTGLRILNEFGNLITYLKTNVKDISRAKISVHIHNDSDCSTNNTLQAILAGADIVEGTFYGLGERSGMTKFEAIIMNLLTRTDIFPGLKFNFNPTHCLKIVNFVAGALGMPVPRHWPVVGLQNGIVSSGTHMAIQVGAKTPQQGYYSWNPKRYGHKGVKFKLNQSSGRAGIGKQLKSLGYKVDPKQLVEITQRVKAISDAKGGSAIEDRDLTAIVQDVIAEIPFAIKIKRCQAIGGEGTIPTATVLLEYNGQEKLQAETGDGPYDAIMKAVVKAASYFFPKLNKVTIELDDWRPIPITEGSEAMADVYARIKFNNGRVSVHPGRAVHMDTNQASAQAFANCLSWYLASL